MGPLCFHLAPWRPQVDVRTIQGSTPLCHACAAGSLACVKLLLKRGAKVNPRPPASPLHESCTRGQILYTGSELLHYFACKSVVNNDTNNNEWLLIMINDSAVLWPCVSCPPQVMWKLWGCWLPRGRSLRPATQTTPPLFTPLVPKAMWTVLWSSLMQVEVEHSQMSMFWSLVSLFFHFQIHFGVISVKGPVCRILWHYKKLSHRILWFFITLEWALYIFIGSGSSSIEPVLFQDSAGPIVT